ncbi:MAG: hypothetical protein LC121_04695, partial [Anaerolineae bacterium]|nr:hypothetical protein [Anaerolineae bacterium]
MGTPVWLSSLAAEFTVNSGAPVAFTLPADTIAPGETVIASYLADETQTEPYTLAVKASGTTPSGTVVEDTDSVRVIPGVPLDALRVTIDSMIQNRARLVYDGSAERPFQTGYPIIIQFTVTNDGDQAVSDVLPDFYSDMDPEGGCYPLDYPETITPLLAPGASITRICEYVPPVGHGLYPTTGSILPSITFAVTGYIDGTEIVGHNDQKQVKLVDLALRVELGAEPTRILPGGLVTFTLSVVNFGASPIGCGSDVAPNSLCHLKLSSPNNDLNAAIAGFSESLKNDVLPPRYSRWFTVTVPMPQPQPNQLLANYAVSVEGGYHDTQIQDVVRETFVAWDTSDVFLVYQLPRLQVSVQAAPNPPVFGQPVAYTVNVTNTGFAPVTITSGAYQIIPLATTRS